MAWQNIYGTCWDDLYGEGHTSSRRGKVSTVGFDCNTNYGSCIKVSASFVDGSNIVIKPDLRTIKKEEREKVKEEYSHEVNELTKINISINLEKSRRYNYFIDGVEIRPEDIQKMKTKEFELALGACEL